jgi:hypothetical protein
MFTLTRPIYRFQCKGGRPELTGLVSYFSSLRESGVIDDEAFYELSRYAVSLLIQQQVECLVDRKIDKALHEKLSPDKLLEVLA